MRRRLLSVVVGAVLLLVTVGILFWDWWTDDEG